MATDILEEHERSSIRGTLLGLAQQLAVKSQVSPDQSVDPYMREIRIWVHDDMSAEAVRAAMLKHLGLSHMEASTDTDIRFRTPNCVYHSISLARRDGTWRVSRVSPNDSAT